MTKRFIVEHNGKNIDCYSEISGEKYLTQIIIVTGYGQKLDSVLYGDKYHPLITMESTARIIAQEIIRSIIVT